MVVKDKTENVELFPEPKEGEREALFGDDVEG